MTSARRQKSDLRMAAICKPAAMNGRENTGLWRQETWAWGGKDRSSCGRAFIAIGVLVGEGDDYREEGARIGNAGSAEEPAGDRAGGR